MQKVHTKCKPLLVCILFLGLEEDLYYTSLLLHAGSLPQQPAKSVRMSLAFGQTLLAVSQGLFFLAKQKVLFPTQNNTGRLTT